MLGMGFRTGCWDNKKWSFPPGFPRLRHVTPKMNSLILRVQRNLRRNEVINNLIVCRFQSFSVFLVRLLLYQLLEI